MDTYKDLFMAPNHPPSLGILNSPFSTLHFVWVDTFPCLRFPTTPESDKQRRKTQMAEPKHSLVNLAHLDHLCEDVVLNGATYRIVHIYCPAPDYQRTADPQEGTACVDDATRAAVVYLRHFELTGDEQSRLKAERLLRFIMYMQTPEGQFHNFVHTNRLDINTTHHRSQASGVNWWMVRAIWALGVAVRALRQGNPAMAAECESSLRRCLPELSRLLDLYPQSEMHRGRMIPMWLVNNDGADATSELLLGLNAYNRVCPSPEIQTMISRFAQGIAMMRYGSMNRFPYGLHASWRGGWHLWGNSQTQALAEAGLLTSAKYEADHFYPRLLVEGYLHSVIFDHLHSIRYYERIAYGIRTKAVGLIRLFEATGEERYAIMGGLAAAWFLGNNSAGKPMYDPATGRAYDGLHDGGKINYNSGAESTAEALLTLLEIEKHPQAACWLGFRPLEACRETRDDIDYFYRVFEDTSANPPRRIGVVMNLTREKLQLLQGEALDEFLGPP